MKIVGIIGKSGSGKTTVSGFLEELGAQVINCDLIAREVTAPGSEGLSQIAQTFGAQYLLPDGSLNRKMLGNLVFGDASALQKLNQITHPRIEKRVQELIDTADKDLILLDAPVLLETGLKNFVSHIILVTSTHNKERIKLRDCLSETEATKRLNAQRSDAYFRNYADIVIENDGSVEELRAKTVQLYHALCKEEL